MSCTARYTPKPRGYPRLEPAAAEYAPLRHAALPFSFNVSTLATVETPPSGSAAGWVNLAYPSLEAKIYCTCLPIAPSTLNRAFEESHILMTRQSKDAGSIDVSAYDDPVAKVYALLYELGGASASPIQFTLTDSATHFFRGALLYDCPADADSLAPLTEYLRADVVELIQSFSWKD
jgi:gliding motility-associated lipoprotein GldD